MDLKIQLLTYLRLTSLNVQVSAAQRLSWTTGRWDVHRLVATSPVGLNPVGSLAVSLSCGQASRPLHRVTRRGVTVLFELTHWLLAWQGKRQESAAWALHDATDSGKLLLKTQSSTPSLGLPPRSGYGRCKSSLISSSFAWTNISPKPSMCSMCQLIDLKS